MSVGLEPLFVYAGGKGRSLRHISRYLKYSNTYVEPFFGAGAVYCHMVNLGLAKRFIINDIRNDIIGIYRAIQHDHVAFACEIIDLLKTYRDLSPGNQEAMFIEARDSLKLQYNAAKHLFVRKSDYGGITKVDQDGKYNGHSGHMRGPNRTVKIDQDQILMWKMALDKTELCCGDFEKIKFDPDGSLVFCDPPYHASRIAYGEFTKFDQIRCLNWCNKIGENRNARVLLSNRDHNKFFSKRIGDGIRKCEYHITYSAGENVRSKETLFMWNVRSV
ncbi:MAG: Dam family site-specific DNA-(adenine-N6)-methyltransferase [Rhodospirillaceae bacterium]